MCIDVAKKRRSEISIGAQKTERVLGNSSRIGTFTYTLIELLSALFIVMILFALLLPMLSRCREEVRRSQCRSIQAGYGKASMLYAGDYDDFLPFFKYDQIAVDFSTELRYYWRLHSPYLEHGAAYYRDEEQTAATPDAWGVPRDYICPSAALSYESMIQPISAENLYLARPSRGGAYQVALTVRHIIGTEEFWGGMRLGRIRKPSTFFLMEDAGFNDNSDDREFPFWKYKGSIDGLREWGHGKYYNVAFVDGHATGYQRKRRFNSWSSSFWREFQE